MQPVPLAQAEGSVLSAELSCCGMRRSAGRDPRFDGLSGAFVDERFRKQYAFLFDEALPEEKRQLRSTLQARSGSLCCKRLRCLPAARLCGLLMCLLAHCLAPDAALAAARRRPRAQRRARRCRRSSRVWSSRSARSRRGGSGPQ